MVRDPLAFCGQLKAELAKLEPGVLVFSPPLGGRGRAVGAWGARKAWIVDAPGWAVGGGKEEDFMRSWPWT